MKKLDLGQAMHILANLGVIAGIVLLAVELNQNNELLRNQARYNVHLARSGELDQLVQMPELLEITIKARERRELTAIEERRLGSLLMARFIRWEWYYEQYRDGLIERENLPVEAWRDVLSSEAFIESWDQNSRFLSPNFVQFVEENVVNER